MDKILDREEKKKQTNVWKNSWRVVLAANGILVLMSIQRVYSFFSSSSLILTDFNFLIKISFFIDCLSSLMLICNLVLLFVSLFLSTTYWKKWLVMVLIGLVLYGISIALYSIYNLDRLNVYFLFFS
ncbi:hypothetical protein V9L05_15025 [Bernardetia sp. Wsw4-3y2]|uniref:hypothetical protein n=1 Tax=Bernardetia sp. Wsw4-3y2 TaxID=3127471 RepID=UPI0030CF3E3E